MIVGKAYKLKKLGGRVSFRKDFSSYAYEESCCFPVLCSRNLEPTMLKVERNVNDKFAVVTLNRPKHMNALSKQLMVELVYVLNTLDNDNGIHVIVLTGGDKCFSGGADIKEMADKTYDQIVEDKPFAAFDSLQIKKVLIGAVSGYALGGMLFAYVLFSFAGGCELAMFCDILYASDTARFGQCEVKLGTIPGMGGTQRLPRAIGKSKVCLLGSPRCLFCSRWKLA